MNGLLHCQGLWLQALSKQIKIFKRKMLAWRLMSFTIYCDMDVGEYIVPVPYVKQVKLSMAGGRLIISSDGVWDMLSAEVALDCCRGMPSDAAAAQIVKEAVQAKGLRDDTICTVVDTLLLEKPPPPLPLPKKVVKKCMLRAMFRKKPSESSSHSDKEYSEPYVVEELFEEGSAMLSERFDTKYPVCNMFKLFTCAVCQLKMKPGEGISIHAGTSNSVKLRPWDGPFLCTSCQEKKEAMEGKSHGQLEMKHGGYFFSSCFRCSQIDVIVIVIVIVTVIS